jgi:hypothetical protein
MSVDLFVDITTSILRLQIRGARSWLNREHRVCHALRQMFSNAPENLRKPLLDKSPTPLDRG